MRIVISTGAYYPMVSGVAVFSHNLALGLASRGHEVMVLCPSQNGRNHVKMEKGVKTVYLRSVNVAVYPDQIQPVPPKKRIFGREVPHLFYKNGFRVAVFPGGKVRKLLDEFRPDIVHVQVSDFIGLSVVSYARKNNIPVVTTEHNQPDVFTGPLHIPGAIKKPVDALLAAYFVNRQGKSDYVTMPTELAIKDLIGNKEFNVPVEAVSNGVDLGDFKPGKAPESLYRKYKLPRNVPTVLYVGRVDPEKNVGVAIDAFGKFLDNNKVDSLSKTLFVVVGDGVDKLNLEKKVREMGLYKQVRFLGKVMPPELYKVYQLGDVFVTASTVETQGIVLIEAAATGLPLIAVDAGAVAEVCRDGENGFLCEPGNVLQMSEAIKRVLSDPELREKFGKKSYEIAHEHDFEKTLDKFIDIYKRLIADKNKSE